MAHASRPGVIALTGLKSFVARGLIPRLFERAPELRVIGLDQRRPFRLDPRVRFQPIDLTDPTADSRIAEILQRERVEALLHAAFRSDPGHDVELDHELETIGSLHVMNACAAAKLRRFVLASTTMLYGPRADNPNFLGEEHPLRGHPDAHCVRNRVEVEQLLAQWGRRHPDVQVTVLRPCWIFGPTHWDYVVRYFALPVVPLLLGYDPLIQFVHEEDVLHAFTCALLGDHPGAYNVVGRGVLPLSTALRLAGRRALRLPTGMLHRMSYLPAQRPSPDPPAGFFDYLRHLWVADGTRGWNAFGEAHYSSQEAWISFFSARRMRRYR